VGELAKVNHVLEYFVDWLQEVTRLLTVWAAYIVFPWSHTALLFCLIWFLSWGCEVIFDMRDFTLKLLLAKLTEKLIALFAFLWLEWKVKAHHTLSFLNHFPLELIQNQLHLYIKAGNGFRAHDLPYSFI